MTGMDGGGAELAQIAVVIPAWQPDAQLPALVRTLRGSGLRRFVIVDDGSDGRYSTVFAEVAALEGVTVCRHTRNRGKGCALKTAFELLLASGDGITGVITADADGQHLPEDIARVAERLAGSPERVMLGVRSFEGNVPLRSRVGNAVSRVVFRAMTGTDVQDTQTGLRGLPLGMLRALCALPGERYEYETVMLGYLCGEYGAPEQMPIATVYLQGNRASHFDPIPDSIRIYKALWHVAKPWARHRRARPTDRPRLRHA